MSSQIQTVLFLCTGNSCRSQMAEAIVNARQAESWRAYSAGVRPAGYVHPMALQVLEEIGIAHTGTSKSIAELPTKDFDLVITVCDSAAEECPVWPGRAGRRLHHSFYDPAKAQGNEAERLSVFRQVRDEMLDKIPQLLME
ncbi:MAG TPA: arsenate reductase ArsC [Burkholderiales bacterium]|nr:arsenate reductase ArsC [Burkholderiales bacterium]